MSGKRRPSRSRGDAGAARRRVWIVAAVAGAVALAAGIALSVARGLDGEKAARAALPEEALRALPDEGRAHVDPGQPVRYRTDPPTSGPHYDTWAEPAFYDQPVAPGLLVHNLEHGHVVIYYDPARLPREALDQLRQLTARHRGQWAAVLAVPREDPEYPLILTAWRHWLRLKAYNPALVEAFVDAYIGRGPENPVR